MDTFLDSVLVTRYPLHLYIIWNLDTCSDMLLDRFSDTFGTRTVLIGPDTFMDTFMDVFGHVQLDFGDTFMDTFLD